MEVGRGLGVLCAAAANGGDGVVHGVVGDPDYEYMIRLFEGCMKMNGIDNRNPYFIWNKNRLVLEKEAIKRQMMNVINKKPAKKAPAETDK